MNETFVEECYLLANRMERKRGAKKVPMFLICDSKLFAVLGLSHVSAIEVMQNVIAAEKMNESQSDNQF